MVGCMGGAKASYCTACWSGKYPIPVNIRMNKFSMERHQLYMFEESTTANE